MIAARHLDANHSEITVGVLAGWLDPVPAPDPRIGTPLTVTGIRACPPALTGSAGTVDVPLTVRNVGYPSATRLLPDDEPSGAFVCGFVRVNGRNGGVTDRRLDRTAATRVSAALRGISTSRLHARQPFPPADTYDATTIVLTYDQRAPVVLFLNAYQGLSNGTILVGTPRWPPGGYPEASGYWHAPGGEVLDGLDALLGARS